MRTSKIVATGLWVLCAGCAADGAPRDGRPGPSGAGGKADVATLACTWDSVSSLGASSADLAQLQAPGTTPLTVTAADIPSLTPVQRAQLLEASAHLQMTTQDAGLPDVFAGADDGEIRLIALEQRGARYDWVQYYAGDTEIGVVFEAGAAGVIVAEISDGDLMACEDAAPSEGGTAPSEPPAGTATARCSYRLPSPVGSSTADLADAAHTGREVSADNAASLSDIEHQQLLASALELHMVLPAEPFEAIFDAVDGGVVSLCTVTVNGRDYDWTKYYAGDTEVGSLFDAGTLNMVGEVSDGDVMGCQLPSELVTRFACRVRRSEGDRGVATIDFSLKSLGDPAHVAFAQTGSRPVQVAPETSSAYAFVSRAAATTVAVRDGRLFVRTSREAGSPTASLVLYEDSGYADGYFLADPYSGHAFYSEVGCQVN